MDWVRHQEHDCAGKFPDISLTNCQNSRIIISTYFQFETIFDAIVANSSYSEHGETKDTSRYVHQSRGQFRSGIGFSC